MVRTTKINIKINQTNTKKNEIQRYTCTTYIHMHTNVILTNKRHTHTHNLTIPIQS